MQQMFLKNVLKSAEDSIDSSNYGKLLVKY